MTSPVRPNEVKKKGPDEVIQAFNELIEEAWDGVTATVYQDAAVARICSLLDVERAVVFDKGWLDVESIFRAEGWKVKYDKPAYCETYKAFFVFSRKKKKA